MEPIIQYIDDNVQLENVTKHLSSISMIGIDLEFDKNHYRYGFNLCLMQIFDGDRCYLIDPISESLDIALIFPVLENEKITKVCFAFNEDMRLLHHIGANIEGVRDLAIARIILGKKGLSLSNTLVEELEREPQNSLQKSNWFQRPLSDDQKKYAALDVVDLLMLNDQLSDQLKQLDREEWFQEEMKQFEGMDWDQSSQPLVPVKERKDMTLIQWMRYEELMLYRDGAAKKMNRPAYKVMDKNMIKKIAVSPKELENWHKERRIHPKYRNETTAHQLRLIIDEVDQQFQETHLPIDTPARRPLTRDEKLIRNRQRREFDKLKETFFSPVKAEITDQFGENLANYMLSNKRVSELVTGTIKPLNYQRQLMSSAAEKCGLELPSILK